LAWRAIVRRQRSRRKGSAGASGCCRLWKNYKEDEKWPVWIGATTEDEQALFETNKKNPINCELSPKSIDYFRKATEDSCAFSWHTGGAYFLFADGSVHFLEESIDAVTYENLGNIADGNVVSDFR
jgi:prepilin-type processing-associated H-X9-DG protein